MDEAPHITLYVRKCACVIVWEWVSAFWAVGIYMWCVTRQCIEKLVNDLFQLKPSDSLQMKNHAALNDILEKPHVYNLALVDINVSVGRAWWRGCGIGYGGADYGDDGAVGSGSHGGIGLGDCGWGDYCDAEIGDWRMS